MLDGKLDKSIKELAESQPSFERLRAIENIVWKSINKRRADIPRNIIESWLTSIFVPQYRIASLSFALVVGLFSATLSVSNPQSANAAQALNLHVFSSNYGITSSIITVGKGDKI